MACLLLELACGYRLVGRDSPIAPGLQQIFIPIFANKTAEPLIEQEITRALRQELMADGRLTLVPMKQADAILEGEILSYALIPLSFDTKDNVTEYRLNMTIKITLQDIKRRKVLFQDSIKASKEYLVNESIANSEIGRQEALRRAARDFALELLDLLTERF